MSGNNTKQERNTSSAQKALTSHILPPKIYIQNIWPMTYAMVSMLYM